MAKKTCKGCKAKKGFTCSLHHSNTVNWSLPNGAANKMIPVIIGRICPKPKTKKEYTRLFIEKFGRYPNCTGCKALGASTFLSGDTPCKLGYPIGIIDGGDFHGGVAEFRPCMMCPKPTSLEKYYKAKQCREIIYK